MQGESRPSHFAHSDYAQRIPVSTWTENWKKLALSSSFRRSMDRVRVLGDNDSGHTGCVNALSWAEDGRLLLSGGDDTTVRFWRMDISNTEEEFPFVCKGVLQTGHTGNIFNAQMLPHSTRITTVAGDSLVRVFDVGSTTPTSAIGGELFYSRKDASIVTLKCHTSRTKRIVTEHSPDLFLSVAEDGAVRQHDLRVRHKCRSSCPAPLIKVNHELSTLSLSPLTPHLFVVAGDSAYGYLFDRRQAGRFVKAEYGEVPKTSDTDLAMCVRRFGRIPSTEHSNRRSDHITGAKVSSHNGHEVLLSYSGDAVYSFSTKADPTDPSELKKGSTLPSNIKRQRRSLVSESSEEEDDEGTDKDTDSDGDEGEDDDDIDIHRPGVPFITPIRRYAGACNVETVKDVNFLGPFDEYVVSGSDDGNFFVWHKDTSRLHGIYEGDGSVVNVIEGHPQLPIVAVSGIDTTVKLFAPIAGRSRFSRMADAESITESNKRKSRSRSRYNVTHLLLSHLLRAAAADDGDEEGAGRPSQCEHQ